MVSSPDGPLAAADTVTVHGGPRASAVDLDSVRRAAALVAGAAGDLRAAAGCCLAVSGELAGPAPGRAEATSWEPAEMVARARALEAAARDTARSLTASADLCDLLGWRLLRAAGLYEEAESTAERAVGALVTGGTFGTGAALGSLGGTGLAGFGVLAAAEVAGRVGGGVVTGGVASAVARWGTAGATSGLAPYTDEAFAGLGGGVGLAQPGLAQGRSGVAGGAGVLAHLARELPVLGNDDHGLRIDRLGGDDFTSGAVPAWSGAGARTVQEALTRVDSLYPGTGGAPPGTVAVQKLTGPDGAVSWTVLIPGTQSALPADHPWDGRTDVELIAAQADGATTAVERALADSGVGPDEPVTLVGHSLGGIAATALLSRAGFAERYRVGGLVTAGSPTGLLSTPPGVPALHLETPEELVSHTDGRSASENPRTQDRVTVVRSLRDSVDAGDRAAAGDVVQAHSITTHVRTLDLAVGLGDPRVTEVADRIGRRLDGEVAETRFYRVRRVSQ